MPCYDPRDNDDFRSHDLERKNAALDAALDRRTDQLCRVMRMLEDHLKHVYDVIPQDIRDWHSEHKAFDRLREKGVKVENKK